MANRFSTVYNTFSYTFCKISKLEQDWKLISLINCESANHLEIFFFFQKQDFNNNVKIPYLWDNVCNLLEVHLDCCSICKWSKVFWHKYPLSWLTWEFFGVAYGHTSNMQILSVHLVICHLEKVGKCLGTPNLVCNENGSKNQCLIQNVFVWIFSLYFVCVKKWPIRKK